MWSFNMLFLFFPIFLLVLLAALAFRTAIMRTHTKNTMALTAVGTGSEAETLLAKAIACRTVSHTEPSQTDWDEFTRLITLLEESFPLCSKHRITDEIIGPYNLVYCFAGEKKSREPALLTAHLDVVGANEHEWTHPPFEGFVKDGYLYGRGSFDCKLQVISILSAFEHMLKTKKTLQEYLVRSFWV